MPPALQNQEKVLDILQHLRGIEPLKELFWSQLNFDRVNKPITRRGWSDIASNALAEDPVLFAAGGEGDAFQVIYGRLASEKLLLGSERPVVNRLLREHPYTLFVFSNTTQERWHFVNVKYDEEIERRQLFRRITVGPEERLRTATERISLLDLEDIPDKSPLAIQQRHEEAFDVEAVTKEFFTKFSEIFNEVETAISGITGEKRRIFTQKLFNRLLFIAFLERKGWLIFNSSRDYLQSIWKDHRKEKREDEDANFYRDRLKLLFFSGLNNSNDTDIININLGGFLATRIGNVPYLNGGLFEEEEDDRNPAISIPDDAFNKILNRLFARFNFTVTESTPLDIEVAVDPEMLGKVFEELVTGRHESGSYYTPKQVVAFMCRQALKGYLQTRLPNESEEAIEKFVEQHNPDELTNPEAALEALKTVYVCDPACGSGAYLLGILHELLYLRNCLFATHQIDPISDYNRKLEIIQNNIYGVDNDQFAINIARLRLWLSLSIEFEGDKPKEQLPNLDFKIETGDSLLGPNPTEGGHLRGELVYKYAARKAEYIQTHSSQKKELWKEIARMKEEIRTWTGTPKEIFDWQVEFAEVFIAKPAGADITDGLNLGDRLASKPEPGGFDIVIANPPYVRQELIGENKPALIKIYAEAVEGRSDLYVYFYTRALQILKPGGIHIFICSNSWLDVGYGGKLQKYLLQNAYVHSIYDSAVERQFASASINTIISIIRRGKPACEAKTHFISLQAPFYEALADPVKRRETVRSQSELWEAGSEISEKTGQLVYTGDKWGGKYLRAPDIYWTILEKGKGKLVRLGDIAEVRRGFTTGCNEFFYLDEAKIKQWGIEEEFLKPVIKSLKDTEKIIPQGSDERLLICHLDRNTIKKYHNNLYEYIKYGESNKFHLRPSCSCREFWYNLGKRPIAKGFYSILNGDRHLILYNENLIYSSDNLGEIHADANIVENLISFLNSTLFKLFIELSGRTMTGSITVVKLQIFEILRLMVFNEKTLGAVDFEIPFRTLCLRKISGIIAEHVLPDRRALDDLIFDELGLTSGEREAVYEAVIKLVETRLKKAKSLKK